MKSGEYQRIVATEWLQKLETENHSHATVLLEMLDDLTTQEGLEQEIADLNNQIKELQRDALVAEEGLLILEQEVQALRNEAY